MPTYDYRHSDEKSQCKAGTYFERFESMTAKPLEKCETCGQSVIRIIGGGSGAIFKGSGFYCNDYPKNTR